MNATVYSVRTGETITAGLPSLCQSDEALIVARRIAREKREQVILDDENQGELLVGPRGGLRKFTTGLKRKLGF